jgi:phage repressor protein C with HTH and peptisase S24 domain
MPSGRKIIVEAHARGEVDYAALSKVADRNHAYIQQFVTREVPRELPEPVRVALAPVLGVLPDDLRESDPPSVSKVPLSNARIAPEVEIPPRSAMQRDIPVYGTAAGSNGDGAFLLSMQNVVDYVRRPPGLAHNRSTYGIYVEGESMQPALYQGDLILVDPARKPRPGDRVVLVVTLPDENGHTAYVKEFVRQTSDHVFVRQYNPPADLTFDRATLASVDRIVSTAEMLGV